MYQAYITRIKNLRKHANADRLQCGECFGNTVVVGLDVQDNQLGIYFPSGGRLGPEFARRNNLLRQKDENGNNIGGYLDPKKRNIKALNMRKERSDGLFLPIDSLRDFTDISKLNENDAIDMLNGVTICEKYIPYRKSRPWNPIGNNRVKRGRRLSPVFSEHVETEQLAYNLNAFRPGDIVEITIKLHGTSQRTGYLPVLKSFASKKPETIAPDPDPDTESGLNQNPDEITSTKTETDLLKSEKPDDSSVYSYDYITGTRHTICAGQEIPDGERTLVEILKYGGQYEYRQIQADKFIGKLHKGETVYYEIVGFDSDYRPIMPSAQNKLLQDKNFSRIYGPETVFSYGCDPMGEDADQNHLYVYRMTMTNEDGDIVEYQPWQIRERCAQIGVDPVPQCEIFMIPDNIADPGEYVMKKAEEYYDGPDPIGRTHVREGVVCRILNRSKFVAFKHKNYAFKVLSGIAMDNANIENMSDDILSEL